MFVDLDHLVGLIAGSTTPRQILEVGCGEGALASRLTRRFPDATYVGIDIAPATGRLFEGPRERCRFEQTTVEAFAARRPQKFDTIVLCDVLHHVPESGRAPLLDAVRTLLAGDGTFIVKDWEQSRSLITLAALASDRVLTGDWHVRYLRRAELLQLVERVTGPRSVTGEHRVRPWRNNLVIFAAAGSGAADIRV
jgi:2-polyprenyl-6-hydroxyphenyl methylase/3-demethylubiquinone-9 3-methyltransferase